METLQDVLAKLDMLESHQIADLNVWSILIVQVIKLVFKKNVEIRALEPAQVLLIVKLFRTGLLVLAHHELKVIPTRLDVHQFLQVSVHSLIFFSLLRGIKISVFSRVY